MMAPDQRVRTKVTAIEGKSSVSFVIGQAISKGTANCGRTRGVSVNGSETNCCVDLRQVQRDACDTKSVSFSPR